MVNTKPGNTEGATRFAIVSSWPNIRNAEYENVRRIYHAARQVGADCLVIDEQGFPLPEFCDPVIYPADQKIDGCQISFVIHLHYSSTKLIDCFSYLALWNPADFLLMHGYDEQLQRLAMHDDFLHIDSRPINRQLQRVLARYGRRLQPRLVLHTSCDDPILEPKSGAFSFFYCGINWERVTGQPGRYDRLLRRLEETGKLSIFGPTEFMGVNVWAGFKSYRGSIPFDGISTIYAINDCGIALVLNSLQHQICSAQSNRFFESLAAGAIVITHRDQQLRAVFGDTLFYVDSVDQDRMYDEIMAHYRWIETHPEAAREMARAAQGIFVERFRLRLEIDALVKGHAARVLELGARKSGGDGTFEVVLDAFGCTLESVAARLVNIGRQTYRDVALSVICRSDRQAAITTLISEHVDWLSGRVRFFTLPMPPVDTALRRDTTGARVFEALSSSQADWFVFAAPGEFWFENHLVEIARSLKDSRAPATHSGVIEESKTYSAAVTIRNLAHGRIDDWPAFLVDHTDCGFGLFGFRRDVLEPEDRLLLEDIDGMEPIFFLAKAAKTRRPAATGSATIVVQSWETPRNITPVITPMLQARYMQDYLVDQDLPDENLAVRILSALVGHMSTLPDSHVLPPTDMASSYALGARLGFGHNGKARSYLRGRWHDSESEFTWLLGTSGKLSLPLPATEMGDYLFAAFRWASVPLEIGERQVVTLLVNSVPAARWILMDSEPRIAFAAFPAHWLGDGGQLHLEVQAQLSKTFATDARGLSLRIFDIAVRTCGDDDFNLHMRDFKTASFDVEWYSGIVNTGPYPGDAHEAALTHYLDHGFADGISWKAR